MYTVISHNLGNFQSGNQPADPPAQPAHFEPIWLIKHGTDKAGPHAMAAAAPATLVATTATAAAAATFYRIYSYAQHTNAAAAVCRTRHPAGHHVSARCVVWYGHGNVAHGRS